MRALVFRLLVAATIALAPTAVATAGVIFQGTTPVSFTTSNSCNNESVDFSGNYHLLVSETSDSSGGEHSDYHINFHVTGTGESTGTKYVENESYHLTSNFNSGGTHTVSEPFTMTIASQGNAPNFIIRALFHSTINPDGTVTSFIDTFNSECR